MSSKYILALDQGTSSSRAILFDKNQDIVSTSQTEFKQYYPKPGWVEHDPFEIFESQLKVAKEAIQKAKINANEIAGIGITNQRETVVVWEKSTGKPIYNAIVWQDKRTSEFCELLKAEGLSNYIQANTGLVIDSYFSATKIYWILKNIEGAKQKAIKGELLAGTIDSWLVWNLTKGKKHITDYSNASRTLIYNIKTLKWDKKLLNIFGVPEAMLPKVKPSSEVYGHTHKSIFNGAEIPISGIAGDQQAALFGQTCFEPGMVKNTYGTGCFMLMNTGDKIIKSKSGLLSTIAWGLGNKVTYAQEGSVFIAGAAIKWLRDGIKIINTASETDSAAKSVENSQGVYLIPAFSGLGAPYWQQSVRGAIFGLTQGVTDKHIIRATLESIAYQTKDILMAMAEETEINIKCLNVDGGAAANNFLMQFQADILNTRVIRPENLETTASGAAYLAGLAVDFWTLDTIKNHRQIQEEYKPNMDEKTRKILYSGWLDSIKKLIYE